MKIYRFLFLLLALPLLPLSADQVELVSGEVLSGKVKRIEGDSIRLEMSLGGGLAEAPYKLALIKSIVFERSPDEEAWVKSVNPADLPSLLSLLERRKPYFKIQGSDGGEIALRIVKLQLAQGKKTSARDAMAFLELVERDDWSAARKAQVPALRISALLGAGQTEKAAAELEKLESIGGSDENAVAEAQIQGAFLKAQKAAQELQDLEKEFPRWDLMPEKRSERTRLIQLALDQYLYAAVFRPEYRALTAQGLYQAALIYKKTGNADKAAILVEEVVKEFPEPEYVALAQSLAAKGNKPSAPEKSQKK